MSTMILTGSWAMVRLKRAKGAPYAVNSVPKNVHAVMMSANRFTY